MANSTTIRINALVEAAKELDEITDRVKRQVLEFRNSRPWDNSPEPTEDDVKLQEEPRKLKIGSMVYWATPEFLGELARIVEMLAGTVLNVTAGFHSQNPARRVALFEELCDANATLIAQFEGLSLDPTEDVGYTYSPRFNIQVRGYSGTTAQAVASVVTRYPELAENVLSKLRVANPKTVGKLARTSQMQLFESWYRVFADVKEPLAILSDGEKLFYANSAVDDMFEAFKAGRCSNLVNSSNSSSSQQASQSN